MPESKLGRDSLVLYKKKPARIASIGKKKIVIETAEGQMLNVRPKDVIPLHPGPIESLAELQPLDGEILTAWELLAGRTTTLAEIAELAYGDFTFSSAWSTWELVADGLYFRGSPEEVYAQTVEQVAEEKAAREAKAAEQQAWQDFLGRLSKGHFLPEDNIYLEEVATLARGQRERSRVMKALGQLETPENAHALLLKTGYWDVTHTPYPARAGLSTRQPISSVPELPDEPRRDLTHLLSLAIDDAGSRDPDDAISLDGNRLWVHIADVSALVPPSSPPDLEARSRGANIYLPDGTVNMLPPAFTEVLGLGLAEISPALSFGLDLGPDATSTGLEIVPSWVRVTRMTYDEAEQRIDESPLFELYELAKMHEERRRANGAIHIELPEVKVLVVDDQVDVQPLSGLRSRDLVREAMLLTGEAVGHFAVKHNIPIPFTNQNPPPEEPPPATGLSEMIALRRSMKPSQQSNAPAPHAGLGMEIYVQATSPLRRYMDLVVHQQLRAYLRGDAMLDTQALMERVGAADAIVGNVRWAERRSIEHWTLVYLIQNPNWRGQGIIVDKRGRRDVILIPALALETQLYQRKELALDSKLIVEINEVELAFLETYFNRVG
jgi:exoribonuclease-2